MGDLKFGPSFLDLYREGGGQAILDRMAQKKKWQAEYEARGREPEHDADGRYPAGPGARAARLAEDLESAWAQEGRYLGDVLNQPSAAAIAQGRGNAAIQRASAGYVPGNLAGMRQAMARGGAAHAQGVNQAGQARVQEDLAKLMAMREWANRRNQYHLMGEDMENQMLGAPATAAAQIQQQQSAAAIADAQRNAQMVGAGFQAGGAGLAGLANAASNWQQQGGGTPGGPGSPSSVQGLPTKAPGSIY